MAQLRAFAICPTCSELYPSFRGCPACAGANVAQESRIAATVPRPRAVQMAETAAPSRHFNFVPMIAALSLGVVVACGLLMAALS